MQSIGDAIRTGAGAFLRREYMSLLPFVVVVTVVLGVLDYTVFKHEMAVPATAISYLVGNHLLGYGRVHRDERGGAGEREDRRRRNAGAEPRRCGWPSPAAR